MYERQTELPEIMELKRQLQQCLNELDVIDKWSRAIENQFTNAFFVFLLILCIVPVLIITTQIHLQTIVYSLIMYWLTFLVYLYIRFR